METYRVLIVDDQRDIRRLYMEGIKTLGKKVEILESPSGEEALMVAALMPIDLLVVDVNLPGISGLDLVHKIRKRKPEQPIVLVTGITDPKTKLEIESTEVAAIFYKPVEIQQLVDAVKRGLGMEKAAQPPATREVPSAQFFTMKQPPSAEVVLLQRLSQLALNLGASAASLLDETGKLLAQSGEFMQTATDPVLMGAIMAAYRSSMEVAHNLGRRSPENVLCFGGPSFSLCLVPIGPAHLLLLEGSASFSKTILNIGRPVFQSAPELRKMVENLLEAQKPAEAPAPVEAQAEPEPVIDEEQVEPNPEDRAKVDDLFSQLDEKKLKLADVDAFWEAVVDKKGETVSGDKDVLTYEQARKMGLAPE